MRNGACLAALDLGSNSFRLEIGKYVHGQIQRVQYIKETVRQGNGLDADGMLSDEAMQRGWDCLARFAEQLAGFKPARVRAVATQTLREAHNRDVFLRRAHQILGFPIDVIAGREEARLIYQGVANLLPRSSERRLAIDIGGRSTEMMLGKNLQAHHLASFPIGSVAWSMHYFADGRLSSGAFARADNAAKAVLAQASERYPRSRWDVAYGSSGTIGAVAELLVQQGHTPGIITREGLDWVKAQLIRARTTAQIQLPGLKEDRRPVIGGGVAVLLATFDLLGIEHMQIAQGALRQGVLYDLLEREQPSTDPRTSTVTRLMHAFAVDTRQARRVERTALQLLRQVMQAQPDGCSERVQRKLRWAARLHEIGVQISHSSYHRHGAYILDNAEAPGFAMPELHNLSLLVLGQRGKLHKLDVDWRQTTFVNQLLALRLAVLLCHARRMPVLDGMRLRRLTQPDPTFALTVPAHWAQQHPHSYYLLQQEADAWDKVGAVLELQLSSEGNC